MYKCKLCSSKVYKIPVSLDGFKFDWECSNKNCNLRASAVYNNIIPNFVEIDNEQVDEKNEKTNN